MSHRALLTTVVSLFLAGCDSHAYYEEAKLYVSEAQQVLRDAQVCEKRVPCSVNDLVKFEAGAWTIGPLTYGGVYINVYEVQDRAVAEEIILRFREKHKTTPDVPVHVRVYGSKHGKPKQLTAEGKMG